MRPLPGQTLHLPFSAAPYRMSMDLVTVPESAWFEFDSRYPEDMAEKRALLGHRRDEVFATVQGSDAACAETLDLIVRALTAHHPDWFSRDGDLLHNRLTAETWNLARPGDPLELAARLVQEDLCLILNKAEGPVLVAAALCFPSRWRLADKIGKPLATVHAPVPLYADRLARPVDRFMRHLKPGHIAARLNWSLPDDPALFQPGGKWRTAPQSEVTAVNAGDHMFLRVERQTLRRLHESDAVLFGIRVHVYPLHRVAAEAEALAAAVRALPPEIQHYKSLLPFRDAVLAWLDAKRV